MSERGDVAAAKIILGAIDGKANVDHDLLGDVYRAGGEYESIEGLLGAVDLARVNGWSLGDEYVEQLRALAGKRVEDDVPLERGRKKPPAPIPGIRPLVDRHSSAGWVTPGYGLGPEDERYFVGLRLRWDREVDALRARLLELEEAGDRNGARLCYDELENCIRQYYNTCWDFIRDHQRPVALAGRDARVVFNVIAEEGGQVNAVMDQRWGDHWMGGGGIGPIEGPPVPAQNEPDER